MYKASYIDMGKSPEQLSADAAYLAVARLVFNIIKKNPDFARFLLGLDEEEVDF